MYQRLATIVRQAPLTWFYSLSVAIVILTIPLFIVTGAQEAIDQAFIITGAPFNTDLLTWGRLVAAYPDTALGAALALLQVGAPDIAVLIVVPLAFGWRGLIDLKRRFRFWPREMPWRRGIGVWLVAMLTFVLLSLATAALNQWVLPVESFTWHPDLRPLPLVGGLLTAMLLDGGGLFEENGWRGFALPLLLQGYGPLVASLILGLLWAFWHIPVKFDLVLNYGLTRALIMFGALTLKFLVLTIIMTYFWRRAGQTTIIGIAMHGLSNDSLRLGGEVQAKTFVAQLGGFRFQKHQRYPDVIRRTIKFLP